MEEYPNKEDFVRRFRRYEYEVCPFITESLWGLIQSDGRSLLTEDGDVVRIPPGYRRKHVSPQRALLYYKPPLNHAALRANGAVEVYDWIDGAARKHWLTIKDVRNMARGDKVQVLVLDRNWEDAALDIHARGEVYSPTTFFRANCATIVKEDDARSLLSCSLQLPRRGPEPGIEFHVEYTPGSWYPFVDGHLPAEDPHRMVKLLGERRHWSEFPEDTPVGFRGPMIRWDALAGLPRVYYDD